MKEFEHTVSLEVLSVRSLYQVLQLRSVLIHDYRVNAIFLIMADVLYTQTLA